MKCSTDQPIRSCVHELTENEMRVLLLMGAGMSRAEMARGLRVKPDSVGIYKLQVRDKLGAASDAEAVEIAKQRGLIQ